MFCWGKNAKAAKAAAAAAAEAEAEAEAAAKANGANGEIPTKPLLRCGFEKSKTRIPNPYIPQPPKPKVKKTKSKKKEKPKKSKQGKVTTENGGVSNGKQTQPLIPKDKEEVTVTTNGHAVGAGADAVVNGHAKKKSNGHHSLHEHINRTYSEFMETQMPRYAMEEVETEAEREAANSEEWQFKSLWGKDICDSKPNGKKGKGGKKGVFKLIDFDLEDKFHKTMDKIRLSMDDISLSGGTFETTVTSSSGSISVSVISSPVGARSSDPLEQQERKLLEGNQHPLDKPNPDSLTFEHDLAFFDDVFEPENINQNGHRNDEDRNSDRNRMAPAGKAIPMDTGTTNGPRSNNNAGQQNGGSNEQLLPDLISTDVPDGDLTIVPVKVEVAKIDCSTQVSLPSHFGNGRLIEDITMSEEDSDPGLINNNNSSRRNSNAHHQSQNAVILENTSLKEEIHQMSVLIEKLQEQLKVLSSNYEKQKAQVGASQAELAATNSSFVAMSLVAQNCDLQRILAARRLSTVQDRCLLQEQEKVEDTKRELCSKFQEDRDSHKEQIASLSKNYEREMRELEVYYEDRLSRVKDTNDTIMADLRRIHEEDMQRLEANYRREMEDMKLKHEEHLADQIKKTPGDILHKEIHSLNVVIEIRNQEIKDLRLELLAAQTKMEGLILSVEQNKGLAAKVEDLEAQLEKTRRDKTKIFEKLNTMETSMSQVVTENDRLHLYTEELTWRIETLKTDDHVNQSMSKSAIEFGTSYSSD